MHKTGQVKLAYSQIIQPQFDARSPLMTYRMLAAIFMLTDAAFRLALPFGGLLVNYGHTARKKSLSVV